MKNTKRVFFIVAVFLVTFGVVFFFAVKKDYLGKNERITPEERTIMVGFSPEEKRSAEMGMDNDIDTRAKKTIYDNAYLIEKGWVKWQEPQDVGDMKLTSANVYNGCRSGECDITTNEYASSGGVKYAKVGNFVEGRYAGGELFSVIAIVGEGPIENEFFRLIKFNDEFIVPLRMSSSYEVDRADSTEYFEDKLKIFFGKNKKIIIDEDTVLEELILPSEIKGQTDRQILSKIEDEATIFFTKEKLKLAFAHPVLGDIWTTDESKALEKSKFELNAYLNSHNGERYYRDFFGDYGFYIKLADGSTAIYKMKMDIFDRDENVGKLLATWNDGTANDIEYEEFPAGCGVGDFIYSRDLEIDKSDLKIIGKTQQGDDLFGFKGTNTAEFKKLYETIYWVKDGNKKSPDEFLKINPEVFWIDPFGRLVAFFRADIISPAECGKPVIYLYPEKPMNIEVRVEPGNGLSITEPIHGDDGWKVFSDTESNIKNLSDGKIYPYLFWEGMGGISYAQPQQGFVVAKDNLYSFFDDKLSQLGLIEKEINDFKEFWIPEMNQLNKPYYFVTFLSKNFIDKLAPLTVTPNPDTVIRVMMDYQGLDNYKDVQEFKIKTPQRNGFTVVEWGGMLK